MRAPFLFNVDHKESDEEKDFQVGLNGIVLAPDEEESVLKSDLDDFELLDRTKKTQSPKKRVSTSKPKKSTQKSISKKSPETKGILSFFSPESQSSKQKNTQSNQTKAPDSVNSSKRKRNEERRARPKRKAIEQDQSVDDFDFISVSD